MEQGMILFSYNIIFELQIYFMIDIKKNLNNKVCHSWRTDRQTSPKHIKTSNMVDERRHCQLGEYVYSFNPSRCGGF